MLVGRIATQNGLQTYWHTIGALITRRERGDGYCQEKAHWSSVDNIISESLPKPTDIALDNLEFSTRQKKRVFGTQSMSVNHKNS
jgi:hypothetical protein